MKKSLYLFFALSVLLNLSCKKDKLNNTDPYDDKRTALLSSHFQDLKIETFSPVYLGKSSLKDLLDKKKRNELIKVRDSLWHNSLGRSSFYQSDEMIVTPDNSSYIYPGSIIKAASVNSGIFEPLTGFAGKPINVALSFPSGKSYGVIDYPALSSSRVFLRNALMDPDFSGTQLVDFLFNASSFTNYNEVKLAYGYNMDEKALFYSVNTSFNYNSSRTNYSTGMMATYTVKNFTYSMSNPTENELIDRAALPANIFEGVSPVFINSVTYGRFGFFLIETNNTSSQMRSVFEKMVKKIFKKTDEGLTQEEKQLISTCRITLNLLGKPGGGSITKLLTSPDSDALSNFISENLGVFTAKDPGVPISFTAKYLKDNTLFKTVFHLDFPY